MSDYTRLIIQMASRPSMASTSFGALATAPSTPLSSIPGVEFDSSYSPVPIPPKPTHPGMSMMSMTADDGQSSYVVRASVRSEEMPKFLDIAQSEPGVIGVFADAKIQPIGVCPRGPLGTDLDVESLLSVPELHQSGLDGTGVKVVIVDTGVNMSYLSRKGKTPDFDLDLSWGPHDGQPLGNMRVGHGTMCAYDVCIAAPNCTLIDHALLTSTTSGGSGMDGFLSDAIQSYATLLSYLTSSTRPFAGDLYPRTLVVNNSWGMFHESWDFPPGNPQNYSDNPDHPFNLIVAQLEAEGADILFAAGNCGTECPDGRCGGVTDAGIFGANSSAAVTCVAGVVTAPGNERIGYSTKGPGRLEDKKPDIASFTHFAGSGVYDADGGTSAACPVAAGVVAAIRRLYPASVISPGELRDLLRDTAKPHGTDKFDYEYGYGVVDVPNLLERIRDLAQKKMVV